MDFSKNLTPDKIKKLELICDAMNAKLK